MEQTAYKSTPQPCAAAWHSSKKRFNEIYAPDRGEEYCCDNLDRMYTGTAPSMRQVKDFHGDDTLSLWLTDQVTYMFEHTDVNLDQTKTESLIRLIKAKYQWMKVTEFMHYVFLFRTGEFGKIYGKADGQTVMLTLKDYCKMREDIIADIHRRNAKTEPEPETRRTGDPVGVAARLYKAMLDDIASGSTVWRSEPWAADLIRWYNCQVLPYLRSQKLPIRQLIAEEQRNFPGNWSYDQRRAFAASLARQNAAG